jgi:hypothetical protein
MLGAGAQGATKTPCLPLAAQPLPSIQLHNNTRANFIQFYFKIENPGNNYFSQTLFT